MARVYADENFPLPCVENLRELGHDVLTVREAGKADQAIADDEVLQFAIREKRCLITLNRKHFIRLHSQIPDHTGIIVCTFDPNFDELAQRINEVLEQTENLDGKLIRINRPL